LVVEVPKGGEYTCREQACQNRASAAEIQEEPMPYVNIRITREGATADQKAALIQGVTRLLADTLGKNPATTVVVIDEVNTDNWGIGGETVTARRKAGK